MEAEAVMVDPWMDWMKKHLGQVEWTGHAPTAFDREIFSHTSFKLGNVMEPGCAATVSAALEETGYKSMHTAWAPSYATYGEACELKVGAVLGFNWSGRGGPADHVTFCYEIPGQGLVACLGGNQSKMVKVSVFSQKNIVYCRWPVKA